jgi:hypothetical protein
MHETIALATQKDYSAHLILCFRLHQLLLFLFESYFIKKAIDAIKKAEMRYIVNQRAKKD